MIFLLFLASVATIEMILRNDARHRKVGPQASGSPASDTAVGPAAESVLALMNTLEQHGRGKAPAIQAPALNAADVHAELPVSKTKPGA